MNVSVPHADDDYIPYSPAPCPFDTESSHIEQEESIIERSEAIISNNKLKKRGCRGSKKSKTFKKNAANKIKKKKKDKNLKPVPSANELFFVKKNGVLPYTCETCGVGTKLPCVFESHLRSDKHLSSLSLSSDPVVCLFCEKDFDMHIHNYKSHFSGSKHFKNLKKFQS